MAESPRDPPPPETSVLEDLLARTRKFLVGAACTCLRRPLDELLRWVLGRAAAYLVAAGLLVTAAVFLLIGGMSGLQSAGVPPPLAWTATGSTAALVGWLILGSLRGRPPRKYS